MKLALVVIGDGRGEFLDRAVKAATENVYYPISARLMIDDSGDPEYAEALEERYPEFVIDHNGRRGMAGAVQAGFRLALEYDPDYVLWIEEDMLVTRELPISDAIQAFYDPLAQMCFPREVCDPSEGDDQLASILSKSTFVIQHDQFVVYDYLFSLFPCLIPRAVLELGASIEVPHGVGIEDALTRATLDEGYVFGAWHGGPYATHIGYAARSAGYRW